MNHDQRQKIQRHNNERLSKMVDGMISKERRILAHARKWYMSDVVDDIYRSIFSKQIPERRGEESLLRTEPHVFQYIRRSVADDINVMTSMGDIAVCMMMISEIYNIPLDEMLHTLHRELEMRGL